ARPPTSRRRRSRKATGATELAVCNTRMGGPNTLRTDSHHSWICEEAHVRGWAWTQSSASSVGPRRDGLSLWVRRRKGSRHGVRRGGGTGGPLGFQGRCRELFECPLRE